jgi:hypothetical protein
MKNEGKRERRKKERKEKKEKKNCINHHAPERGFPRHEGSRAEAAGWTGWLA